MGGVISPVITGLFTQYTPGTWRNMCWLLASLSSTVILLQVLFVLDTGHHPCPYV